MSAQWKKLGAKRLISATQHSSNGLKLIWRSEAAFRQEAIICVPLCIGAFFIADSATELVLLIGASVLVMIVEVINSAIEATIDRIGLEHHPLSGKAKDLGSLAVMMCLLLMAFTWLCIVGENFF